MELTSEPISAAAVCDRTDSGAGAVVTFEGRVRDRNGGKTVVGLHYDSYPEMADEVLRDIQRRTLETFAVSSVSIVHRAGSLSVGDVAVVVSVVAPHRAAAFDAARFALEAVKAELPVWKREEYEDGSRTWLEGEPGAKGSAG
ncbi:MAG: molybdenum cofactor biosynthesis protein MoaE [Gemmatimonadota bacterium]|nr:molybdenum cofactor biosynthesis protein MoaE [Gemmatimonadota bacterium]